ncbi:MAG: hypothetical protein WDZ35_12395 [Crocinitomicaceae bacterium]
MLELEADARVWIFQSDRLLKEGEVERVHSEMKRFMQNWAAHGNELYGDFSIENGLFLIVGADEKKAPPSGCSIDALTHKIKEIGKRLDVDFFNRLIIAYEDPSTDIHLVNMETFKALIRRSEITEETTVYNNLIDTVGDLEDKWRTKVGRSWHKNLIEVL